MGAILTSAPEVHGTDSTGARVRSATLTCIGRFGLTKTTLDDVARESGVSRATIYRAFPGGRETLFDSVLTAEVGRFFEDLAAELDRHDDLEELLVAGLTASMRFLAEHEALHAIATLEPGLLLPQLAFHRLGGVLTMATAFAAPYLEPHLDSPEDAFRAAEHIVRIVLSYTLYPSDAVDPLDPPTIRRLVWHHLLPGLHPAAPGPRPVRQPISHEGTHR